MKIVIKGVEFYTNDNEKTEYKDNYNSLSPEKQAEVDLCRATRNYRLGSKPETVDLRKQCKSHIINILLDAKGVHGEMRQRLFNNYFKNRKKRDLYNEYVKEVTNKY